MGSVAISLWRLFAVNSQARILQSWCAVKMFLLKKVMDLTEPEEESLTLNVSRCVKVVMSKTLIKLPEAA